MLINFPNTEDELVPLATICFARLIVAGADCVETEFVDKLVAEVDPPSAAAAAFVRESVQQAIGLLEWAGGCSRTACGRILPKLPRDAGLERFGRTLAGMENQLVDDPLFRGSEPASQFERALAQALAHAVDAVGREARQPLECAHQAEAQAGEAVGAKTSEDVDADGHVADKGREAAKKARLGRAHVRDARAQAQHEHDEAGERYEVRERRGLAAHGKRMDGHAFALGPLAERPRLGVGACRSAEGGLPDDPLVADEVAILLELLLGEPSGVSAHLRNPFRIGGEVHKRPGERLGIIGRGRAAVLLEFLRFAISPCCQHRLNKSHLALILAPQSWQTKCHMRIWSIDGVWSGKDGRELID